MVRVTLAVASLAALAAIGAGPASSSPAAGRELVGTTGPGFTITLTENGEPVTSLRPGVYWLTVSDLSTRHNFHLVGPGVDELVTTVPFTGTTTVKIHLGHGEYTFKCDPHARLGMLGTFEVGGAGRVG